MTYAGCASPTVVGVAAIVTLLACAAPTPAQPQSSPTLSLTRPANSPNTTASASPVIPSSIPPPIGEITVFAASSLTDAFNELGAQFKAANPGATVTFNFGASTQLFTQLDQGALADVFASADKVQMDRARMAGRIAGPDAIFATNRLIVITPGSNPGGVQGPEGLARPGLKVVTSQADVPIGVYTQAMLDKMSQTPAFGADFKDRVNANIVSREPNVRQIVGKVQLGEADAGVAYRTDVTPQLASQLLTIDVPDEFNTVATYPIARVQAAHNPVGADSFVAFVLSPAGQTTLAKWSFTPGNPSLR